MGLRPNNDQKKKLVSGPRFRELPTCHTIYLDLRYMWKMSMNHLNEIESEPCKVIEGTSWPHAKPSQLDLLDWGYH